MHIVELVNFFLIPKTFFNRLYIRARAKRCGAYSFSIVIFSISHSGDAKQDNNNINVRAWCVLAHILLLLLLLLFVVI